MKKTLKFIGKAAKVYLIFDVLVIACIGATELIDEYGKHPEYSTYDNNCTVFERSKERLKNYFRNC